MKRLLIASTVVSAMSLLAPHSADATNLVQNGDFSTLTYNYSAAFGSSGYNPGTGAQQVNNWTLGTIPSAGNFNFVITSNQTADGNGAYYGAGQPAAGPDDTSAPKFYLYGPNNPLNNTLPSNSYPSSGNGYNDGGGSSAQSGGAIGPHTAGTNFLALDSSSSLRTTLKQTIDFGSGATSGTAHLTFYWAGAQQAGFTGSTTDHFTVSLGSNSQDTATVTVAEAGFSGWQTATMDFAVTTEFMDLSFLAIGTPDGQPPFALLSEVALSYTAPSTPSSDPNPGTIPQTGVPEPASATILAAAVAGLMASARRHRRKAK